MMDELIKKCLDMDDWKHSWHNDFECIGDFKYARDTIACKISERLDDLQILREGLARIDSIIERELQNSEQSASVTCTELDVSKIIDSGDYSNKNRGLK